MAVRAAHRWQGELVAGARRAALSLVLGACASDSAPRGEVRDGDALDASSSASDASHAASDASLAAPDGGAEGPSTSTDAASACSENVGSCPSQSFAIWASLLAASEVGSGARLVATGGESVLVELGDRSFRAVHVPVEEQGSMPRLAAWDIPAGERRPAAITDRSDGSGGKLLFVLACGAEATSCSLLYASIDRTLAANWDTAQLPPGFVARGLVVDDADFEAPVTCVYGNGLLCFDGAWREAIAPSAGLRIADVAIGWTWSVAVGDEGRWFKRVPEGEALGAWVEQPAIGAAALTQASVAGAGAVIVGEGRIQAALGEQRPYFSCEAPKELIALLLHQGAGGFGYALTSTGEVLRHLIPGVFQQQPYCAHDTFPAADVLDVTTAPCGISLNPRVLTANELFGVDGCAID